MGSEIANLRFPTEEEAQALLPEGRMPYRVVRLALHSEGLARNRLTSFAIRALAKAQDDDVLEPPLPQDLAETVELANRFLDDLGRPVGGQFNHKSAWFILEAVFEHGYRSDGA